MYHLELGRQSNEHMTKCVKFLSGYALLFKVLGPTVGPMVVNTRISS